MKVSSSTLLFFTHLGLETSHKLDAEELVLFIWLSILQHQRGRS